MCSRNLDLGFEVLFFISETVWIEAIHTAHTDQVTWAHCFVYIEPRVRGQAQLFLNAIWGYTSTNMFWHISNSSEMFRPKILPSRVWLEKKNTGLSSNSALHWTVNQTRNRSILMYASVWILSDKKEKKKQPVVSSFHSSLDLEI